MRKQHVPEEPTIGTAKKCYNCLTETSLEAAACPRCGVRLGPRKESGVAARPGSPLPKLLLAAAALAIVGFAATRLAAPAATETVAKAADGGISERDAAIRKIKEKGAGELGTVGVADIGYKDDTFCVYVDQRFADLSSAQQEQVLSLVAGEWKKAIGKASTSVKVLKYGTDTTLAELTV